jgi:capsid protein
MSYWAAVDNAGLNSKVRYINAHIPHGTHVYTISRATHDVAGGKNYSDTDLVSIRAKSRRAAMSGTVGPMICNARILDAIGDGFNPIPSPNVDLFSSKKEYAAWKKQVNYEFQNFIANPINADGITSLVADLWEMVATCILDGDCFVRIMYDARKATMLGSGLCWRIVPGSSICNKDKAQNGPEWYNGIHYDKNNGRADAISYAVNENGVPRWKQLPIYNSAGERLLYYIKLPLPNFFGSGFRRGLPLVANVIDEINIVDEYRRAALSKVASEGNFAGVISGDENYDPFVAGESVGTSADGKVETQKVGNATLVKLRPGEKFTPFQPSSTAVQYPDFAIAMINEICASTGTSPEIARMLFGGSYSGSMAGRNISSKRQTADRTPVNFLISDFYKKFLKDMVAKGTVKAKGFESTGIANQYARLQVAWAPNGAINPLMQARANEVDLKSGILTKEQICAREGYDYAENVEQQKEEAMNDAGIERIRTGGQE